MINFVVIVEIFCDDIPPAGTNAWSHQPQSVAVGHYQIWWCWEGEEHPNGQVGTSTICDQSPNPLFPHDWERSIPGCAGIVWVSAGSKLTKAVLSMM